jgi:hypothetical protein
MRHAILAATLLALPATAVAQGATTSPVELGLAAQLASAVAPLPAEFRESATVLGHAGSGAELVVLRAGSGPFICLADRPGDDRFHAACYHASLEPFMARGRELRAQGIGAAEVDTLRYAEVLDGRLEMPRQPAALYSLTGGAVDPETGEVTGARPLYVVYIAFATAESTGLPTTPVANAPWLMFPGTPKAHIMFIPDM